MFLSNLKLHLLDKNGLSRLNGSENAVDDAVLISASLCLYVLQDLSDVPKQLHKSFIAQRVLQLSPFENSEHYTHLSGDMAQLWIWDKALQTKVVETIPNPRYFPEQLFLDQPDPGFYLRSDSERFQLELWGQDNLLALKTFSDQPSVNDQAKFLSKNQFDVNTEVQGLSFDYLAAARDELKPFGREWFVQPRVMSIVAGFFSLVLLSGFLGYYSGWLYSLSAKKASIEVMTEELRPLLLEREETLALDARNAELSRMFHYVPVIDIAAEFESSVGAYYDELLEWNYERGELVVLLVDSTGNSRKYIEALSSSALFQNVSAEPGIRSNSVRIQAGIPPGLSRETAALTQVVEQVGSPQ